LKDEIVIYKEIISAVDIHRKAMELVCLIIYCSYYAGRINKKKLHMYYSFLLKIINQTEIKPISRKNIEFYAHKKIAKR